jgi:threonine dehydratase
VGAGALLAGKVRLRGPVALILSGRNLDRTQLAALAAGTPIRLGDREVAG